MENTFKIGEKVVINATGVQGEVIGIFLSKKFEGEKYDVQFLKDKVVTTSYFFGGDLKKCA